MKFPKIFRRNEKTTKTKPVSTFRCLERSKYCIEWRGVLSRAHLCTHFLYCLSLRYRDKDEAIPDKLFDEATHEIRIGYRLNLGSRPLFILYVAQYDFSYKRTIPEYTAEIITTAIAQHMMSENIWYSLLLRPDCTYWDWFICNRFKYLMSEKEDSSS